MVTYLRQGLTNYPTSVTDGSIPTANAIIDVSEWAMALEPRKTPLLTLFGVGDPVDTRPLYWGQSYRVPLETTANEAIDNSETGIDVATGTGKYFQQWTVFEAIDFIAGSTTILDDDTREIMLVTSDPAADTLTVVRAQGGTSAVSHSNGCMIKIIGTAEPQLNTHSISPVVRGTQLYNYMQRFSGGVKADIAARNTPTWEHKSDPMLADFAEEQLRQKLLLEMAIWRGGRQAGDVATPLPAMFGGMDTFITTNVTDLSQSKLTPRLLESELRDLAKNTDGGAEGIMLLMSYNTAAIFDLMIDPVRLAKVDDTTISLYMERVKFRFGSFDIAVSHNAYDGSIWGVRKENFKVRPFKGANWHISRKDGSVHGVDHDEMYVSGDFTLQVIKEKSMFKLTGFNQDLDQYDSPWGASAA